MLCPPFCLLTLSTVTSVGSSYFAIAFTGTWAWKREEMGSRLVVTVLTHLSYKDVHKTTVEEKCHVFVALGSKSPYDNQ